MPKANKSAATIRRRRRIGPALADLVYRHKSSNDEDHLASDGEELESLPDEPITDPPVLRLLLSSTTTLFLGLLAFRVVNALVIQTQFSPDEYWQTVEVAHNMVFGYGFLTWEWRKAIRSYLYPFLFAVLYKILDILHLDYRLLLVKLPNLLQAVFAALGDLYLYKWSRKLSGQQVAQWSLLCQLTSWFTFYCCTRTLANSMETVLTTMALYYFPWPARPKSAQWKYVCLVGLAVVMRPTAAILWLPLCVWHLWMYRQFPWRLLRLFAEKGFIILTISSVIDRIFYGKWVNVHYNFLQFNFLSGESEFFGTHPWHWYLTQGLPILLGSHIFPFVLAVRKGMESLVLALIAWTTLVYSCLDHKEFRFLYPLLPVALHVCGTYLHYLCEEAPLDDTAEDAEPKEHPETESGGEPSSPSPPKSPVKSWQNLPASRKKKLLVVLLLVTNLPLAMYTSLIHQRGPVDAINFIYAESLHQGNESMSVIFLMSGHSTPYYSHIHQNISMRILLCYPPSVRLPDEACDNDDFHDDPMKWVTENLAEDPAHLPTHLVMYSKIHPSLGHFYEKYKYKECARLFHTHVPDGERMGTHFVVMCREQWLASRTKGISTSNRQYLHKRTR